MDVGIKASRDFHNFFACMGFGFSFFNSLIVIKNQTSNHFHYFLSCMTVGIKASRGFYYFYACMGFGFSFLSSLIVIKSQTSNYFH
jgi:uncharacterized transporter YbjL